MMVRIDIDPHELLEEIDFEELLDVLNEKKLKAYLEKRRIKTDVFTSREDAIADLFAELRRAIQLRDINELTAILDSYEQPKWRTPEACEKEYLARRAT